MSRQGRRGAFSGVDYDGVVALRVEYDRLPSPELAYALSMAYIAQGTMLFTEDCAFATEGLARSPVSV